MTQPLDSAQASEIAKLAYDLDYGVPANTLVGPNNRYQVLRSTTINNGDGYFGVVVKDTISGLVYISNRGTTPSDPRDLLNDAYITAGTIPPQLDSAQLLFNDYMQNRIPGQPAITTSVGHSLGGYLAQLLGITNNLDIITMGSPGVYEALDNLREKLGVNASIVDNYDQDRATNFVAEHDPVGEFNTHIGNIVYLDLTNTLSQTWPGKIISAYMDAKDQLGPAGTYIITALSPLLSLGELAYRAFTYHSAANYVSCITNAPLTTITHDVQLDIQRSQQVGVPVFKISGVGLNAAQAKSITEAICLVPSQVGTDTGVVRVEAYNSSNQTQVAAYDAIPAKGGVNAILEQELGITTGISTGDAMDVYDTDGSIIGSVVSAGATVVSSAYNGTVSFLTQMFFARDSFTMQFMQKVGDNFLDAYKTPNNTYDVTTLVSQFTNRLLSGEDIGDIAHDIVTNQLSVAAVQSVFQTLVEYYGDDWEFLETNSQLIENTLVDFMTIHILSNKNPEDAVYQVVTSQVINNALRNEKLLGTIFSKNGNLTGAGAAVSAAALQLVTATLNGGGINSATITQASLAAAQAALTTTSTLTAIFGPALGGSVSLGTLGGLLANPLAFNPMGFAIAIAIGALTQQLLKPKIVHGETVSHIIETQPDGSLKVVGLREAGALLRTTGNTNDDYIGTDSADDSAGADVIVGQSGKNEIYARGGHDFIEGRANDDYIDAGTGNDHVEAGDGNDFVDGGSGNDRIYGGNGNDNLIGNTGNDLILGGNGDDRMEGNDGADQLFGGAGIDTIIGGAGKDIIDGGADDDVLSGEADNDEIDGGSGNDDINGDGGDDILSGNAGNDQVRGGSGKDIIFGDDGVDILYGDEGDDALDGGTESDLLFGGIGNDTLAGGYGDDDLYGEIGSDLLAGGKGNDLLNGGDGDDLYIFNAGDGQDTIEDGAGTNRLLLRGTFPPVFKLNRVGDDLLISWLGSTDTITVKNHFVTPGLSEIYFDGQSSYIPLASATFDSSGVGTYSTWFGATFPTIYAAQKSMYQQLTASFMASTAFSTGWLNNNFDTSVITDAYQLEYYNDVQVRSWSKKTWYGKQKIFFYDYYETQLKGSGYSDRIVGLFAGETINGDSANDQLYGNGGIDTINGGIDHDIIFGGEGVDTLSGEAGNDKIFGGFGNDIITGGTGNDTLYGEQGVDNLSGGDDDDFLSGGDDNDTLNGDAGNDLLYGEQGDDTLNGGSGGDYLNGGAGNDTLNGGSGNDILFGEDGNDILNGDDGDDIILGGKGTNTINGGNGIDTLVLSGDPKDYNIVFNTDGSIQQISDLRPDAPDGVNNLTSIDKIRFGDKEITISDIFKPAVGNFTVAQGADYYNYVGVPQGYTISITQNPVFGYLYVINGTFGSGISYNAPDKFSGSTTFKYKLTSPEGLSREFTGTINVVNGATNLTAPSLWTGQNNMASYIYQNEGLGTEELISARMTKLSGGGYVVTWSSYGEDGSVYGVYGRVYTRHGVAVTNKFLINSATAGEQYSADPVALSSNDSFAVAYTTTSVGGDSEVKLRFFIGASPMREVTVNQTSLGNQSTPKAEVMKDGYVVVVWQSNQTGAGTNGYDIYARRFDSNGNSAGNEIRVNQTTLVTGDQVSPQIAALADGSYVIVWEDQGANDGSGKGIYAQRITASGYFDSGTFQGSASLVNTTTTGDQNEATVAALRDGGFVVTWTSADADGTGIYAQRYDASGVKAGSQLLVNTTTTGTQSASDVIGLKDGGFFVVWQGPDVSGTGIYGQRYSATGTAIGSEFLINSETANNQYYPTLAEMENGDIIVSWQSFSVPATPSVMTRRVIIDRTGLTLTGTSSDDILIGGDNMDIISGGAGNDIIQGGLTGGVSNPTGPNLIDGGDGIDTAVFTRSASAYNITINQNFDGVTQVVDKSPNNFFSESSQLTNIEQIRFSDQTIDLVSYLPSLPKNITLTAGGTYQGQITLPAGFILASVQAPTAGSVTFSGNTFTINAGSTEGNFTYRYAATSPNGITKFYENTFAVKTNLASSFYDFKGSSFSSGSFTKYTGTVNSNLSAGDGFPRIAKLASGGYVSVWTTVVSSGYEIVARLFDANDTPVGSVFTVNTTTANTQTFPNVVSLAGGGFAVTWSNSADATENNYDIKLQTFNDSGTKVGSEITVNDYTTGMQSLSSITQLTNGNLILTWLGAGTGGTTTNDVWVRAFTSSGVSIGSSFRVGSSNTAFASGAPIVVGLSNGNYMVAWVPNPSNGVLIKGAIYNSSNIQVVSPFDITTYGYEASIAALQNGNFVVTYTVNNLDAPGTDNLGVYGQIFNSQGQKIGSEFRVNSTTAQNQGYSDVTTLKDGGFMVVWRTMDSSNNRFFNARRFDASGVAIGGEFTVDPIAYGEEAEPEVIELASGDIIFQWRYYGQSSTGQENRIRHYSFVANKYESDNILVGGSAAESIYGGNGNDTLVGEGGNDIIDGGNGADTSVYKGNRSDFTVTIDDLNVTVVDNRSGSPQGTDTLTSIEKLKFDDVTVNLADILPRLGKLKTSLSKTYTYDIPAGVTVSIITGPTLGTLAVVSGKLVYTAPAGTIGSTQFTYQMVDSSGTIRRSMASVDVFPASAGTLGYNAGTESVITTITGNLGEDVSSMVRLKDGSYAVTYPSGASGTTRIYVARFTAAGVIIGSPVMVSNAASNQDQFSSSIVALNDGGFVVVLSGMNGTGGDYNRSETYMQRYNSSGATVGAVIQVNPNTNGDQSYVNATVMDDGKLVVAYQSVYASMWGIRWYEAWSSDIVIRTYDTSGTAIGGETVISSSGVDHPRFPAVASLDGDRYVAIWQTGGQPPDGSYTIRGQIMTTAGTKIGSEFTIESQGISGSYNYTAEVAGLQNGGFVVTWHSTDASSLGVFARWYDAAGTAVSSKVTVNAYFNNAQVNPQVIAMNDGGAFITWSSAGEDGSGWTVKGQRYDRNGNSVGQNITINSTTTNDQYGISLVELLNGDMVFQWEDRSTGTPRIVQRRFSALGEGGYQLTGDSGDDVLVGGGANDTLTGGAGNDILVGGAGSDTLIGGAGNDTYRIDAAQGADVIDNQDSDGFDRLALGTGIDRHELWFSQRGYDLRIDQLGTLDSITIRNWYLNDGQKLDEIKLSDGSVLAKNKVDQLVSAMAGFNPQAIGSITGLGDLPPSVQSTIAASWA